MSPPLFGALILDRDPYTFADLPGLIQAYLQDAGGFLFLGGVFYYLITLLRPTQQQHESKRVGTFMLACMALAVLCYGGYWAMVVAEMSAPGRFGADRLNLKPPADPTGFVKVVNPKWSLFGYADKDLPSYVRPLNEGRQPYPRQALLLTLGGLFSILQAAAPFVVGAMKLRGRRIWAVTLLTMKEVVRNRVFLAFLLLLIPLMFPINWFLQFKAGDELKIGVKFVGILIAVGMILAAMLLSAFSLPNDVKSQNIYTLVTKPMERFELVLGRFIGYVLLFTGTIGVAATLTLLTLLTSNPSEQARQETMKARVPVRGKLSFLSRKGNFGGTDVGREFNYRKYIGGDPRSSQRAVYEFAALPSALQKGNAQRAVEVEFSFDIYRLSKGEENRGVDINVRVTTWQCEQTPPRADEMQTGEWKWADDKRYTAYLAEAIAELNKLDQYAKLDEGKGLQEGKGGTDKALNALRNAAPGTPEWEVADKLAAKYGYYELTGKQIFDFETDKVAVPAGLFAKAAEEPNTGQKLPAGTPRVRVYVHCTTSSQMLGMAEGDLYILEQEQPFWLNYLKSAFGLWCWLVLVIGLSVTLSTYLDAIITLLTSMFLFVTAFFTDYILELSQGAGRGTTGPFAALNQLLQAKQPTSQAEGSAIERAAESGDVFTGWGFRRLINVLPDVESFYWLDYVSSGFNVPVECMVMNVAVLLAYLFPWLLMAYFLIRGREVAA